MAESSPTIDTRTRLIDAALHLFGQNGFDGTSTRALAGRAQTNVASISYHFGSKQGLREACVHEISARVAQAFDGAERDAPQTPAAAAQALERIVRSMVSLIVTAPHARDMVRFILRDMTGEGEMTDLLYGEFVAPRHKMICTLWARATGRDAEEDAVRLTVFAMVGQILYFNLALPLVARRMTWSDVGHAQAEKIADAVVANLRAALERDRI